jgi:hypothetical protein
MLWASINAAIPPTTRAAPPKMRHMGPTLPTALPSAIYLRYQPGRHGRQRRTRKAQARATKLVNTDEHEVVVTANYVGNK